ncbi:ABC transporter permease [Daejeonella oryzae]|uniref:ABC transporter permease n=1 Tax=Daejeonella oryzae TaxID=1122943 RepID=UPI00041DEFF2|nr:ABC transporter permease [Daejeonella oryzae]
MNTLQNPAETWDMVIEPKTSWFDLRLNELWQYRDLLFIMVKRDFIAAYKQTILGPIWHFLQPLFTTIVFVIVFGRIARIPTDNVPAPLFYLCGLTLWNYFSACLNGTSNTFIANAGIFGKVYFPRLIIPLSVVISNAIKLGIQLLLLIAMMAYYAASGYQFNIGLTLLWVPVLILIVALLGLALGILISALTTKYRDMSVLMGFGVQLLMYATPVIYPLSYIPEKYKTIIGLNPLTWLTEAFRKGILGEGVLNLPMLGYAAGITIILLLASIMVFSKVEKSFMDTV